MSPTVTATSVDGEEQPGIQVRWGTGRGEEQDEGAGGGWVGWGRQGIGAKAYGPPHMTGVGVQGRLCEITP